MAVYLKQLTRQSLFLSVSMQEEENKIELARV